VLERQLVKLELELVGQDIAEYKMEVATYQAKIKVLRQQQQQQQQQLPTDAADRQMLLALQMLQACEQNLAALQQLRVLHMRQQEHLELQQIGTDVSQWS
jgi:hypothetical protein